MKSRLLQSSSEGVGVVYVRVKRRRLLAGKGKEGGKCGW